MEAGISDYLEKGKVEPDVLERSIRCAMERVRAERALRDSEARHRSTFDHLPIGLYRIGIEGDLVDANPALVSMLGHLDRSTLESMFARNYFVNPAHRQTFLDRLGQSGVLRGFESDLTLPPGQVTHTRNAVRSHRDEGGRTVYIEGAVEDVSEERAVRDLHGRAARFGWVFDFDGAELRGRPLATLADPDDHDDLAAELAPPRSGGADPSSAERRFVAADGGVLWARTRTGLVRTPEGDPDHVRILFEDVAEAEPSPTRLEDEAPATLRQPGLRASQSGPAGARTQDLAIMSRVL